MVFSKALFLKDFKSQDCVVKYELFTIERNSRFVQAGSRSRQLTVIKDDSNFGLVLEKVEKTD